MAANLAGRAADHPAAYRDEHAVHHDLDLHLFPIDLRHDRRRSRPADAGACDPHVRAEFQGRQDRLWQRDLGGHAAGSRRAFHLLRSPAAGAQVVERTTPSRSMALALSFLALIWVSPFFWLFTNAF